MFFKMVDQPSPSKSQIEGFAKLGLELAAAGRREILKYYRQNPLIEDKPDLTPVTIADRNAEAAIRKIVNQIHPNHGVMGEEYGNDRTDAEFVWVLDPIDGTKSFMTGKPLFGCLIALCQWGQPILGVIDMPALDEVWLGGATLPATMNGQAVRVRDCSALNQAVVYATTPDMFVARDEIAFAAVKNQVKYILYGADCYGYATVAAGWADAVVEAKLKPYDYLACAAVVQAAGGFAADWQGQPLTLNSGDKVVISGSATIGDLIVKTLQSASP